MLKEFKEFVMRGNLIELAVALILALAFKAVVDAVILGVVMPVVAAIFGQPNFGTLTLQVGSATISYGIVLDSLFTLLAVALVLFFVMKAYNRIAKEKAATTKGCSFCATDIPLAATRCPNCTSELPAAA
jgi:large conductance mechanosensitive channel